MSSTLRTGYNSKRFRVCLQCAASNTLSGPEGPRDRRAASRKHARKPPSSCAKLSPKAHHGKSGAGTDLFQKAQATGSDAQFTLFAIGTYLRAPFRKEYFEDLNRFTSVSGN